MLAMVLTNDRKTRLERRPVPTPRDDQVLVDVDLCGICGSDLHALISPRSTAADSSWDMSRQAG
jgi:threonine dehydrogenase-like Zn-dependent dehydrogenase